MLLFFIHLILLSMDICASKPRWRQAARPTFPKKIRKMKLKSRREFTVGMTAQTVRVVPCREQTRQYMRSVGRRLHGWPHPGWLHRSRQQFFPYQFIRGLFEILIGKPRHETDHDKRCEELEGLGYAEVLDYF